MTQPPAASRIIPRLRYRDAPAAIAALCDAFCFEGHPWWFGSCDPGKDSDA